MLWVLKTGVVISTNKLTDSSSFSVPSLLCRKVSIVTIKIKWISNFIAFQNPLLLTLSSLDPCLICCHAKALYNISQLSKSALNKLQPNFIREVVCRWRETNCFRDLYWEAQIPQQSCLWTEELSRMMHFWSSPKRKKPWASNCLEVGNNLDTRSYLEER